MDAFGRDELHRGLGDEYEVTRRRQLHEVDGTRF
jgi:hypothetical protein